jgi:hypothetical protein
MRGQMHDDVLRLVRRLDPRLRTIMLGEATIAVDPDPTAHMHFAFTMKASRGARSVLGRDCRDAFLGLMKTCQKLGISFWDYLGDRLGANTSSVPRLADLVAAV